MLRRLAAITSIPILLLLIVDFQGHPPQESPDSAKREVAGQALAAKHEKLQSRLARFDQPDQAMQFFLDQRLGEGQTELPVEHMWDAFQSIRARESAVAKTADPMPGDIAEWNWVGPGNIGGRTRVIEYDPSNPSVMYAAGVGGGVFKSTDSGTSWNPTDDLMMNLAVCALAIDPTNTDIIYAGTGEGFGTGSPFIRGLGVFKSTDAGASWNQLSGTVSGVPTGAFYHVNDLLISPNDPTVIYAATRYGVWKSADSGTSWSVILSNPWYVSTPPTTNGCNLGCTDIAIRTDRNPDVIFAAFGVNGSDGLYRSDDGGSNWQSYSTPSHQGRMEIAIAPSNNDIVYVIMADNGGLAQYGRIVNLFRAVDGETFSPVLDMGHKFSPWLFSYVSIATGCYESPVIYSQGWYDNAIAVDPVDPDIVWVGGINTYRSDDGGATFGIAGYWFYYLMSPEPPEYIHPDQHIIKFHPDYDGITNQEMWVGNDGGIFRTQNARAATSQEECPIGENPGPGPDIEWLKMNNGYGVTQYYHGDAALDTDMFVAGAQDNGTNRGISRTDPNGWDFVYGGDGGYVAIDPTNSQNLYIEIQGFPTFLKSTDGGDTFADAVSGITESGGIFINPFAMCQTNPDVLWTGATQPWRTTDGATSWHSAGPVFGAPDKVSAIAIAPSDSNYVYLGFTNGYVARTTDGMSVSPSWSVLGVGLSSAWVSSMAVDPTDPTIAYLTYSNFGISHVRKSTDGGATWQSIDGIAEAGIPDIPVHWITIRPSNSEQLYAGTEFGVFASDDGGSTWAPANIGLAHTVVEALDFTDDNTIVAFTHGRGVFVGTMVQATDVATPTENVPPERARLAAAPTPFNPTTTIRASIPKAGPVHLAVYDPAGRLVNVLYSDWHSEGELSRSWDGTSNDGRSVGSGIYFVRLEAGDRQAKTKVVLTR